MITWITANIGSIIVSLILILIVIGAILTIIKDKKQGRSACGGNCAHCKMCTSCTSSKRRTV